MARLIEFFTRGDELVLDPFAGVGGTLLGAAICRRPRRALGFEIEPRWAEVYRAVTGAASAANDGAGPVLADLGDSDPGGPRHFDPRGCRLEVGDALELIDDLEDGSVDFVATDPPYNPQLRVTMSGGPLAERFANRRTDYAMVTDDPADLANSASYEEYLARMELLLAKLRRVLRPRRYAIVIVRDAYQEGRYRFVASDLAARATPTPSCPTSSTSTSSCCVRSRPSGGGLIGLGLYVASSRRRTCSSVAISMTVHAIASAPSKMAWSAEGVAQASANSFWWFTAPWVSMPSMGWMDGTSCEMLPMSVETGEASSPNTRPSDSAWRR
jgi:hypothetical protein